MAQINPVAVRAQTRYCILFIPIAEYIRLGDVAVVTVFGFPIYRRIGTIWSLFGCRFNG